MSVIAKKSEGDQDSLAAFHSKLYRHLRLLQAVVAEVWMFRRRRKELAVVLVDNELADAVFELDVLVLRDQGVTEVDSSSWTSRCNIRGKIFRVALLANGVQGLLGQALCDLVKLRKIPIIIALTCSESNHCRPDRPSIKDSQVDPSTKAEEIIKAEKAGSDMLCL